MRLIDLKDQMLKVLSTAQKERKQREGLVRVKTPWGHDDTIPAWCLHEMNVMLEEVNRRRTASGLPEITLQDVQKVESQACGHSDYTSKFALYCAELTFMNEKEIRYP